MQEIENFSEKKKNLLKLFDTLLIKFPEKEYFVKKASKFLHSFDDNRIFYRDFFNDGHFTAGIIIFNKTKDKILLMHHLKTGKWHHFGGHADGEIDLQNVALRELEEEAGIFLSKNDISDQIIGFDIHEFPKKGEEPEHLHYDINFVGYISEEIKFIKQDSEAQDIHWFQVKDLQNMADTSLLPSGLILSLKNLLLISK